MAHAHILREDWNFLRTSKVWNNFLACHRGCVWFEYFVLWRWSIARLYDFVGITFFGHVMLKRHNCLVSMLEVLLFLCQYWTFAFNLSDLNIHTTIKKITSRIMLGRIPLQKFCFYHLPTRGRAGIKLGDAWYVSNVSIIFIVPCYIIFCFGHYWALLYNFILFLGLTY